MIISNAFKILKAHFKSHSAAALALGFTKDHYRALRNGRANIPPRTAEYILLKAAEVEDMPAPPLPPCTPPSVEARA